VIYSIDQGVLAGAVSETLRPFVADKFAAPNSVGMVDDGDGAYQPITWVKLPNNAYLVATIHVSDEDHVLASQLAAIAQEAGNDRLARLLGLVAGGLDYHEIAQVIDGGDW